MNLLEVMDMLPLLDVSNTDTLRCARATPSLLTSLRNSTSAYVIAEGTDLAVWRGAAFEGAIEVSPEELSAHLKESSDARTDGASVTPSDGVCFEIDDTTWDLLLRINSNECADLSELDMQWLSDAGLIEITSAGRAILTSDARTWINSTTHDNSGNKTRWAQGTV